MRKVSLFTLLFFIALTGWAQKKQPKKKSAAKINSATKINPVTKTNAAMKVGKNSGDSTLQFIGSELVISVDRLDIMVNSTSPELFPVPSLDGNTLYFSRKNNPDNKFGIKDVEDIWYSTLAGGKWDYAKNMNSLNTIGADYICQIIPPNGKGGQVSMILGNNYKVGGQKKSPLLMANATGKDTWSKPTRLRITGSKGFSEKTDCFMTRDRKYLIISWTEPAGRAQKDLYISVAGPNNIFGKPQNLGRDINTKGNDRSPFLLADGRTLFFSSDGFSNTKGHQDIYVTYRTNSNSWTSWSTPQNLGPKVNGPMDELGFTIQEGTNKAFFCKGVSDTDTDIFTAKVSFGAKYVTIQGKFMNKVTKKPVVGRILLIQNSTGNTILNTTTDAALGSYAAKVPVNQKYHLLAISNKGVRSEPVAIDLEKSNQSVVEAPTVWFGDEGEKPEIEGSLTTTGEIATIKSLTTEPMNAPPGEVIQYQKDSVRAGVLELFSLTDISTYVYGNKKAQVMISALVDSRQADREEKIKSRINEITDYFVRHGVEASRIKNQVTPADSDKKEENTCRVQVIE